MFRNKIKKTREMLAVVLYFCYTSRKCSKHAVVLLFIAPDFEKVEGAYCFWLIRISVRASAIACVQKQTKLGL